MSELDTVAVALNASAERLHDTIEREREFTANASHQLRTPLAGLRLELESALADRDSDARAAMTNALRATDHLEATVAALLAVARDRPTAVATAVKDVLSRAADRFTPTLAQQTRPLLVDAGDAEDLSVRSSRAGLDQMLDVLLDNASRHGRGAVHLSAHAAANAIAIDVTNEGPPIGVPSRELFARRNEHATGHGIGLPLARSLAEADGGRLNLTSTDPPTFTILLPGDPGDRTA
jgi:signal transduction histidine kinase